MELKVLFFYCR